MLVKDYFQSKYYTTDEDRRYSYMKYEIKKKSIPIQSLLITEYNILQDLYQWLTYNTYCHLPPIKLFIPLEPCCSWRIMLLSPDIPPICWSIRGSIILAICWFSLAI